MFKAKTHAFVANSNCNYIQQVTKQLGHSMGLEIVVVLFMISCSNSTPGTYLYQFNLGKTFFIKPMT